MHTEGILLHTEGVFWWRLILRYHQVSYTPRLGGLFAIVVVGAAAIRASTAFEERRNKGRSCDSSLKSPIDIAEVAYISASAALKSHLDAKMVLNSSDK